VRDARVQIVRTPTSTQDHLESLFHGSYETETGPDGHYEFRGIDPTFEDGDGPVMRATHQIGASFDLVVPRNDARVDIQLVGAGTVDGHIVSKQRQNNFLRLSSVGRHSHSQVCKASYGLFRFYNVPPGEYFVVCLKTGERSKLIQVVHGKSATVVLQ
jgi:hypothetical protein